MDGWMDGGNTGNVLSTLHHNEHTISYTCTYTNMNNHIIHMHVVE